MTRVLVVEGSPTHAEELRRILESEGFEVETARDAAQGYARVGEAAFDLVLSDVVMPGLSGYDLCRMIKADSERKDLPVILLTTLRDPMDIIKGLECGADNFITKPYRPDELVARIRTILENRRLRSERHVTRGVEVYFLGRKLTISSGKEQILDLLISTFEDVVRTNRDLEDSRERLARSLKTIAALYRLAAAINEAGTEDEVLEHALDRVLDLPGVRAGWVVLRDDAAGFRIAAARGLPATLKEPGAFAGECECRRRLLSGNLEDAAQIFECERLRDRDGPGGLRYHASVPLWTARGVVGVVNLVGAEHDLFNEDELRTLHGVGHQIGIALERAALKRILENRVRVSEEKYRQLMEHAHDAIFILDRGGAVLEANRQAEEILGLPRERVLGRHYRDFLPPAEVHRADQHLSRLAADGAMSDGDVHLLRVDGRQVCADISASVVDVEGGRVVLAIARDVTQRNDLQRQFQQAQKMEAIGRLASGVAHDFNNLLTAIIGYSELLLSRIDDDEEDAGREELDEIRKAGQRATELTRQLLAFSRKQILSPRVLDLNAVVRSIEKMLRRLIGADVELACVLDPRLGRTRADPGQIEQVIMNLIVNARDAMPRGGSITIETADVDLDESYARSHADVQPGPHVMLSVSDTGSGMDEATRARIFEPFFTTKEVGKGTGLGLSTVYGIVKQSGGSIWVYSEVGIGTTFKIYLPRIEEPAEAVHREKRKGPPPKGWETILLVEDEAAVREFTRKVLELHGYTVLVAADAAEAIPLAAAHRGRIHLLVTDMVMPGLNGRELADRLAAERPGLRVLFLSGYTSETIVRHGGIEAGLAFLQKPFSPDQIARRVRAILDAPPNSG